MNLFTEKKATQVVSRLLSLGGGQMNYMKIIKLVVIIDRTALDRWGFPVTFDEFYSAKNGQILTCLYDLIKHGAVPGGTKETYWSQYISPRKKYNIEMLKEAENDEISIAEMELIDEIWENLKDKDQWELEKITKAFPEYIKVLLSRRYIPYESVFKGLGKTAEETEEIMRELNFYSSVQNLSA